MSVTRLSRPLILAIVAGMAVAVAFAGGFWLGGRGVGAATSNGEFALLGQVDAILDRTFVGDAPGNQKQVHGAAAGLVRSYADPYTVFLEPAPREVERDELRGHFGGIGAYMRRNDNGDLELTVLADRPAALAGVKDGDLLVMVDDHPITPEMTVQEVVALVRGEEGTRVVLKVRRPPAEQTLSFAVVRQRIETPSVESRVLDATAGIGYARLSLFGERSSRELQDALDELAQAGVTKLVLDLRQNGGGLVDSAVDVASLFLTGGNVLLELKRDSQERFYPVRPMRSPAQRWELVILTNGATASASEIVAGALRDQGRAIILGEKTFGKGSVQEVHQLEDGSSLHVTVARWLTPNRNQIDQVGLKPDFEVIASQADLDAGKDPQLERATGYLKGDR
jgi:carboxyl-terminal processing protease